MRWRRRWPGRARRDPVARLTQALRRRGRGRRDRPRDRRRRVLLAARPVGLRQDDDAADDRRLRARRRAGEILLDGVDVAAGAAAPPQRPHGVPELRALPAPERVRQRRLRAAVQQAHARSEPRARRGGARAGRARRPRDAPPAASSPAASSSASRSPGRSSCARRCCCSTSRSARSTRRSASSCGSS